MARLSSWVLCRKWLSPPIKILWRVPLTVLYIYLSVSSWGQSCMNRWHVLPIQIQSAENDPSCRCYWGTLWAYYTKHEDFDYIYQFAKLCFPPRTRVLGSSAIVNVSGQNWFRTLCGSLGQIRLGALKDLKGSAEGSAESSFHQSLTKVPPRFSKFRCASGSLREAPFWAAKRFRGRFHQGSAESSAKVSPRFHAAEWSLIGFHFTLRFTDAVGDILWAYFFKASGSDTVDGGNTSWYGEYMRISHFS